MAPQRKYTRDVLAPVVANAGSIAQVIAHFGLKPTGGSYTLFTKYIAEYDLDTSHFHGMGWNRHGVIGRKTADDVLVRSSMQHPTSARLLRRSLLEIGRSEECDICELGPEWNGRALRLQIDHRNGDRFDNRPTNVRFVCPNCHCQTENWGSKGKLT